MIPIRHKTSNFELGAPLDWDHESKPCDSLPVTVAESQGQRVMVSCWKPSEEELNYLDSGGCVALWVYGDMHPVVAVGVDDFQLAESVPSSE